jgi:serine/threonine-protein kinase
MGSNMTRRFRRRQRLGQYRIEKCLAVGGFAEVYRAHDTIEGIDVALKIPHPHLTDEENMAAFKKEVRMVAKLDHPGILGLKTASLIDGTFVVVSALADETLADRMTRRIARTKVLKIMADLLEALAYAHKLRVVHCDVKPENILLFPGQKVRLADFGLAKLALRTIDASGSGTIGYIAPEQAHGRPSLRSDVFSAGVLLWRLLGGAQPEWPFHWPHQGYEKVQRNWSEEMVEIVRRATQVDEEKRYRDAGAMLRALNRAAPDAIRSRRRL